MSDSLSGGPTEGLTESAGASGQAAADVLVVGAGPAGSAAAYHLARHGLDVLLLEKSTFPRDKVCGDGLGPRAVHQLRRMGVDVTGPGWHRNRGVRLVFGGRGAEVDWPESTRFPDHGLTRSRHDFDDLLARRAVSAGARLWTSARVTHPVLDRSGRARGVRALVGPEERPVTCEAPVVIAADGVSARLAVALGVERLGRRPVATAIRRYHRSPARHDDGYLEIWADLRAGHGEPLLPGYAWVFPMGDGRVNVGLGLISDGGTGRPDTRRLLDLWLSRTPEEWGLSDAGGAAGSVRGAALGMGFNRLPHYTRGVLLAGDAGGMISPWNGEGISYAMEAGEVAAEIVADALARGAASRREALLRRYPRELHQRHARYYRLGTAFARLLSRPAFVSSLGRGLVASPAVRRLGLRLLANVRDERGGDALDRVLAPLIRAVPARLPRARS